MEVGNPPDHCSHGDEVIAVGQQFLEQLDVLGVPLRQPIVRMGVVALLDGSVLAEVVQADHFIAVCEEVLDKVAGDEARRSGDQDFHGLYFSTPM